jgi:hypothetical protein
VIEKPCPKCDHRQASLLLKTDFALYLECDRCEHEWHETARPMATHGAVAVL